MSRLSGQVADLVYKLNSTTLQEQTAIPSVPNSSPQLAALNSLVTLLASSQNLDLMIGTSISILQPHASTSTNVDLRLAVHHLTDEMTDHLASATSHLLQLVDRDELTVLSEMYDIPVAGTLYYSRKPRQSENDEDSHLQPSIPSPRRLLSHEEESRANRPAYEGEEAPLFGASAPVMSTSQSLPGPTCPQNHSDHPGIISSTLYTSGQAGHPSEDRFTTIPSRKPRLSKRSSWDSEVWSKSYSRDGLRRPSNDRRITEADEEDQEDEGKTSWASGPKYGKLGDHAILTNLSGSPSLRPPTPYTPSRTSPLSRIMSKTPDHPVPIHIPVTTLPTGLFSSPIIMDKSSSHTTSSNSKRRSLQDMPYYHTTNEDPVTPSRRSTRPMAGADLGRTMSLPTSDLQELRTKSATGLRRSSLAYAYQSFSSTPPARLTRVPSVSPLTAPGLKAACLGIHLKRRRMACCLLGLRFSSIALVEYWEEVKATIDELNDAIVEEREKLNRARERAEIEVSVAARLSRTGGSRLPIPIWPTAVAASTDFAPRTSDQQFVLERVDALHSALTKAWADLATIRQSLHEPKTLTGQWSNLREDLGSLLREWERGKDAVCRLSAPVTDTDVVKEEIEPHLGELPEFLDGWTDDLGTTPASFPRVDGLTLEAELSDLNALDTYHEDLPRPGVDQVYEATVLPIRRDQSALSSLNRDQRIRLTKEARGKGMSVGDMLVSEMGGTDAKRDKETRIRGSAVVLELKGMIGMIRRKKGQAEELDTKSVEVSHTPGQEVRTAQRDLALGDDILTNELQSKFVFPAFDRTRSMGE